MAENENHEVSNSYKDFMAQMGLGPLDDLLGSVSYNEIDNVDGKTQQLRTSARVFKKMKFDMSNSVAAEKKEEKKEVKPEEPPKPEVKKPVNHLWTSEEKNMFFEALSEHGKDFETIHTYISTRLKKKGVSDDLIKTKHQIRHFYYKTFHMLLGSLKFSEKVPKNAQELYTLINYGEMRRKIGSVSKKNWAKLGELINFGCIALRIKGKTIRVKTPMCRALRRLNQLDEKYDDLKLPTRVLVELKPKDMVSFLKVQSMAQNPRIKVAVSLQKRLSSLLTCVNVRWKTSEALVYDKAVISVNAITKDCVPDQKVIEENSFLLTPHLRLSPPLDAHVELPSIDISEYFSGQSISLTAFETRKGVKAKAAEVKKEELEVAKAEKSPIKHQSEDSGICDSTNSTASVNQVINEAVNTILSLQTQESPSNCDNKNTNTNTNKNAAAATNTNTSANSKNISAEEKRLRIEQIRQGWTVENCGSLTVGEIYLMFGSNSKLVLEYSWDKSQIKSQHEEVKQENSLSTSLKKLLSLAKMHCTNSNTNKVEATKCSCGHVCGSNSAKSNAQFKKPPAPKTVKKTQVNHDVTPVVEEKHEPEPSTSTETKSEQPSNDQSTFDCSVSMAHLLHTRDTIQRLNPKCRSRGRGRYKQLVVERKLVPNKSESQHQIVSMNIVPQESQDSKPTEDLATNEESHDREISMLLGSNKLLDGAGGEKNFSGLLGDERPSSAMSTGLSKILKENENQWMNSDVTDYSLSSLLGHLDCPSKTNQSLVSISNDDTQLSQDVDAQLRTLLIETSVDYTAKFADLAAQVVDGKK